MGLFNLIFRLGMDSTSFNSTLEKSVGNVHAASGRMSKSFETAGRGILGVFGVGAITAAGQKVIEYAGQINDMAESLGVSTEAIQAFDYAAKQNGTTLEAMITAMNELAKSRARALSNPGGAEAGSFAKLGIDRAFLESNRDPSLLLIKVSDAVQKLKVDLNTVPVVLDLIGQRNATVIPALKAGLSAAAEEARELGLIIGDETVKKLDDVGDSMVTMGKKLMTALAPALTVISEQVSGLWEDVLAVTSGIGFAIEELKNSDPKESVFKAAGRGFAKGVTDAYIEAEKAADVRREASARRAAAIASALALANPGNPEAVKRQVDEIRKLTDRLQELTRGNGLAGMSPADRLNQLAAERDKAVAEHNNIRNKALRDVPMVADRDKILEQFEIDPADLARRIRIEELNKQVMEARRALPNAERARRSDSLIAVGNFLGAGADDRAAREMQKQNQTLLEIKRAIERQSSNLIQF